MSKTEAFEGVRDQIGFCGIWCGSCAVGNGALRELTKRFEIIIKGYGLSGWGPKDFDFKEFEKGLVSIQTVPLCLGCLKGGGRTDCEIRACARTKKVADCSECNRPAACKNSELLEHMRTGASQVGIFVKTDSLDRRKLLSKWTAELESRWPSCTLFLRE